MESWQLDILQRVQAWDKKGETRWLIMAEHYKSDAVRIANLLRNNGYEVKIEEKFLYTLTISRKEIIHI